MDVLDKYKETWKNQPDDTQRISKGEIYKLAHKKSTSIVKWIFIIGVLEILFINSIGYIFNIDNEETELLPNSTKILTILEYLVYPVLIYFIYSFYKNYKSISVTDDTKTLMAKILKTRRTVKNYILFNLCLIAITMSIVIIEAELKIFDAEDSFTKILFISLIFFVLIIVLVTAFWIFYQLLYGILLRKLNRNYKELAKLDESN